MNWMQDYAAREMVALNGAGRMSRRDMMKWLTAICGSTAAATTFLAACSSDSGSDETTTTTAGPAETSTSAAASTTTSAPATLEVYTGGPAGRVLSVADDDPDIAGGDIEFDGPAGTMFGYFAVPATLSSSRPGVIVIHEIFGLTDHIRDVARRVAKAGFVAIAPDLASRAGGTAAAGDSVVAALTGGPVSDRVADLDASAARLAQEVQYNGNLGVVGFCFGGGMTLSYAAAQSSVRAAVPYYGPVPQPASDLRNVTAAVLANLAETDGLVNGGIPDLDANLAATTYKRRTWKGTGHAFNNDTGGAYNEDAAVAAWKATIAWFNRYLV